MMPEKEDKKVNVRLLKIREIRDSLEETEKSAERIEIEAREKARKVLER